MGAFDFKGEFGAAERPARVAANRKPWAKDPTAPGLEDGTRLDATFLNDLRGLLLAICTAGGVTPVAGDDEALVAAITAMIGSTPPATHNHDDRYYTEDETDDLVDGLAPLETPVFTGVPEAPTPDSADDSTKIATTAFVQAALAAVIGAAPAELNTLVELAAALGDDDDFAATVTTALAGKLVKSANLSDLTSPSDARTALGLGAVALLASIGISDVTGLTAALAAKVADTRSISAAGLATGGGNLSADRTITVTAASQAEAEAGTATNVAMTPERVAQAIAALAPGGTTIASQAEAEAGVENTHVMTPLRTAQAIAVLAPATLPRGFIDGLTLSNNGADATNDIDIAIGAARDDGNTANMVLAAAITKRLDAAWAVGSGNGGLDTGSIANGWYHLWLIKRPDTGVVDVLFSASATSPTMPANYTLKRRIGSVLRASAALVAFSQRGDEFLWATPVQDLNAASQPTTTAQLVTLSVPSGVKVRANVQFLLSSANFQGALVSSPDSTDIAVTTALASHVTVPNGQVSLFRELVRTNTSQQVRIRGSATFASVSGVTNGWIDARGKE
jgi:hypothetical protein